MLGPNDFRGLSNLIDPSVSTQQPAPTEYIVEHLDYTYISSSSDIPYLQLLASILKYLNTNITTDLKRKGVFPIYCWFFILIYQHAEQVWKHL
jgi:hypothetical protein